MFGGIETVLEPQLVCGESVHHNMTQLTTRGVVKVTDGHPEDLPNWILTAMKCLAQCECICVGFLCRNGWIDIYVVSVLVCDIHCIFYTLYKSLQNTVMCESFHPISVAFPQGLM